MKNYKHLLTCLLILQAAFLWGCSGSYRQTGEKSGSGTGNAGSMRFLVPWVNNKITVQCVVEEVDSAGYKLNNLAFYSDSIKSNYLLFSQRDRNYPIALFPLRDNSGNLMTIWESGVTYRFRVFSFRNDKIEIVLEGYSQSYPELFYENKTSEDLSILITNVDLVKNKKSKEREMLPVSATLYRWKDNKYISIPNIPWAKRFSSGK
ncbi:MAG: hypothetical protein ACM3U0_00975 [archaeon]